MDTLREIPGIENYSEEKFFLIAGPCVVESYDINFRTAETLKGICAELELPFIFKSSYRKANRSSVNSFTGIGDTEALEILGAIKKKLDIPILTDVHAVKEVESAAEVADVLQIPAFLCRQTDLIIAAAKTGKYVNIKKGQFLSPGAMQFAVDKVRSVGNQQVMVTERGNSFGYNDLIVDFTGIPVMQQTGAEVILDVTHSVQKPNQSSGVTGGNPQMIETLAKAGIAAGVDGIFLETHPNPPLAKSDGANMLPIGELRELLIKLIAIRRAI